VKMDNNSERKRLCRIERKRKKAALRVTLLKRILVTAVCAAIITGMGRDLIPAMAEETTAASTGSVPAVSASGSTDTGNNSGAVGSTAAAVQTAAVLPSLPVQTAQAVQAAKTVQIPVRELIQTKQRRQPLLQLMKIRCCLMQCCLGQETRTV
jgi:hypothetical protein